MHYRRRHLLGSALSWLAAQALPGRAAPITGDENFTPVPVPDSRTLRSYVDVLIPADQTPAGSVLGVDKQLSASASLQPDYQDLLVRGLTWLDATAQSAHGKSFAALGDSQRESIVQKMAAAAPGTLQRLFFERTRADAMFHYYGKPESWRGIRDYGGPPQPAGFMHHAQAPRRPR